MDNPTMSYEQMGPWPWPAIRIAVRRWHAETDGWILKQGSVATKWACRDAKGVLTQGPRYDMIRIVPYAEFLVDDPLTLGVSFRCGRQDVKNRVDN
jgi:hypothetical protein